MSTAEIKTRYTPDDLLSMPDGDRYELVDGNLVEKTMGAESCYVASRLLYLLTGFCEDHCLGWVWSECGFHCFPDDPNRLRRPDVAFVRLGRLPNEQVPKGHVRIPPDLAVEVLSPNDLDYETDEKVEEYLRVGVRLVWVVNPESRTVLIYRADGSIAGLREHDELSGEDVVPGFRCRVAEIFATPGRPAIEPPAIPNQ